MAETAKSVRQPFPKLTGSRSVSGSKSVSTNKFVGGKKLVGGNKSVTRKRIVSKVAKGLVSTSEPELAEKLVDEAADASDVTRLCETYGLRREDLGRLTGFSLRALADWSAGKLPSEPAKRRLHEIRRLLDSLAGVVNPKAIAPWLKTRNPAFDNMTPIQVIEVGEIDRLWQRVYHLGSDSAD